MSGKGLLRRRLQDDEIAALWEMLDEVDLSTLFDEAALNVLNREGLFSLAEYIENRRMRDKVLSWPIERLGLPEYLGKKLVHDFRIDTIGDLRSLSEEELRESRWMGDEKVRKIREALERVGAGELPMYKRSKHLG